MAMPMMRGGNGAPKCKASKSHRSYVVKDELQLPDIQQESRCASPFPLFVPHNDKTDESVFDFNSTQPLPWHKKREELRQDDARLRSFAYDADNELLDYLKMRNVSTSFLTEIDQFLQSHSEIASYPTGKAWIKEINSSTPLDAFRYFLRGYTRPARYVDLIRESSDIRLPVGFRPVPLRDQHDIELDEFFEGFEYRSDILDKIDNEVAVACRSIAVGRFVNAGLRNLVCYTLWGNPVDAYKWYEYNYQEDYLPHRYLSEHTILCDIPKPDNYAEPIPSVIGASRRHGLVRFRMARAQDQGVDVLDVLLKEYRMALVRKGYRRREMDRMCSQAKICLDRERDAPTGAEVVNMIMDDAVGRASMRDTLRVYNHKQGVSSTRSRRREMGTLQSGIPKRSNDLVAMLKSAKTKLAYLYAREEHLLLATWKVSDQERRALSFQRAYAERRYVNTLVSYLHNSDQTPKSAVRNILRYFSPEKMQERRPINRKYLLGLYPRELE